MQADIIFIIVALAVIGFSYYALYLKPKPKLTIEDLKKADEEKKAKERARAEAARQAELQARQQAQGGQRRAPAVVEPEPDSPRDERGMSKADQAREAKKQAKKERQEAERQALEERRQREEAKAEKEKEKDEKEAEKRAKEDLAVAKLKEEQKRKEEEEYKKWASQMEVVESGDKNDDEPEDVKLQKFIDYITLRKVVPLEDLASRFKISNKEVIQRIKDLEALERLTGIIDDRGKYIYLKRKELDNIMRLIKSEGKISRADLVNECSRIVSIEPTAEDKIKIKQEEEEIMKKLNSQLQQEDKE